MRPKQLEHHLDFSGDSFHDTSVTQLFLDLVYVQLHRKRRLNMISTKLVYA
jgi:hypothetical protein